MTQCSARPNPTLRMITRITAVSLTALQLSACLPRDAPTAQDVRAGAATSTDSSAERIPYALITLSPSTVDVANRQTVTSRVGNFGALAGRGGGRSADVRISVGDVLGVTIFEAAAGGLFIPAEAGSRSGNFVQIPNQQVDGNGFINVPYAGNIKVAGQTSAQAGAEIAKRLQSRAIEPQAVVTISDRRGNDVSIIGEVNNPARISMDPGGLQVLGAIARAGGPRYPLYETTLIIQRGGRTYKSRMSSIANDPRQNIQVLTGDTVILAREQQYVMAFGATPDPSGTNSRRVAFENDDMTLAEGLAKAGGLRNERADIKGLFVFRLEARSIVPELGIDPQPYHGARVPTVYSLDLSTSDGMFLANAFKLRDRDIIVASDAGSVDYLKFITLVNQTAQTPYNIGIATR